MRQGELGLETGSEVESKISGFTLIPEFITEADECELLANVERGLWETDWRRRIQQYGLGYAGEHGRKASWVRDFPDWLNALAKRVEPFFDRFAENSVINEYVPPLGIGPHRDYPTFGATVACVSLGADIVMDFIHSERELRVPAFVPTRSLWVITGEARYQWQHSIATRLTDVVNGAKRTRGRRVSITFRTAKDQRAVEEARAERLHPA
ncbi:MAG: 2OG-Fe(II) oxygenase [Verrucomicrobiales bacterium]|nr:2OG-Fe(II) oxygenase [Verrucomicrobiales bacterium]